MRKSCQSHYKVKGAHCKSVLNTFYANFLSYVHGIFSLEITYISTVMQLMPKKPIGVSGIMEQRCYYFLFFSLISLVFCSYSTSDWGEPKEIAAASFFYQPDDVCDMSQ